MKTKFELGDEVKDLTTGMSGIVTIISIYMTGPTRYLVESLDDTGRPIEWWFDEGRLVII